MRKILVFFVGLLLCATGVDAAVRGQNINQRTNTKNISVRANANTINTNRATTARATTVKARNFTGNIKQISPRNQTRKSVSAR